MSFYSLPFGQKSRISRKKVGFLEKVGGRLKKEESRRLKMKEGRIIRSLLKECNIP